MSKVKIKVIRIDYHHELSKEYGHELRACPIFKVNDEFVTRGIFDNEMPEGFCAAAWQALVMPVNVLATGGKVLNMDDKHVACCTDGLRPVTFELSRVDED